MTGSSPCFFFLLRAALRAVAVLLLAYLLLSLMQSGPRRIEGVEQRVLSGDHTLRIGLPHQFQAKDGDRYAFDFTVPVSRLALTHDFAVHYAGCIEEVRMGDKALEPAQLPQDSPCRGRFSSRLLTAHVSGDVAVHIVLRGDTKDKEVSLAVERLMPFPFYQWLALCFVSIYLLGFSLVRGYTDARRYHVAAASIGIFFLSFTGHSQAYVHPIIDWSGLWSVAYHSAEQWRQLYFLRQYLAIGAVLLACLWLWRPALRPFGRAAAILACALRIPPRWFVGGCAAAMLLLCGSLSQLLFGGLPQVPDSTSCYVQGKIFASGALWEAAHPLQPFFDYRFLRHMHHRVFSMYFPGHSLMLAIGHVLGAPWLVNPVLGALTVVAGYFLGRETGGRRVGYLTAVLLLLSPFVFFMSSEFMAHSTCLLAVTGMLFAYIRQHRTGDPRFALMAGFCAGYAFITRPQTVLALALPLALHALWGLAKRRNPGNCLRMAGMGLPFVGIALYWNYLFTGHPLTSPQEGASAFARHVMKLEFLRPDAFRHALALVMDQGHALHQYLFGWPVSSLVFVFLLFLLRGARAYAPLLLGCALSLWLSLFLIPVQDGVFGPRYLYESAGILAVLTAQGLVQLPALLRARLGLRFRRRQAQGMIACYVALAALIAVPTHVKPHYALYENEFWAGGDAYYRFLLTHVEAPALVLVGPYKSWWRIGFTLPPRGDAPYIFAQDRGEENARLMAQYPNRHVYRATGWDIERLR